MSGTDSARRIDQLAVEWIARRDRDDWNAATQLELEKWLAEDPRHRGAYSRADAVWAFMDRGRALAGGRSVADIQRAGRRRSRQLWAGGIAAAVAMASIAMLAVLASRQERFDTRIGEIRQITLADGSTADLNTQSRLKVSLEPQARIVELARGEAWFRVARDAARPFIVEAGRVRVRALGTAFSVRRRDEGVEVLVTDGVVSAWVVGKEREALRMSAGSRAFIDGQHHATRVEAEPAVVERALAWRVRQIGLESETLAYAVAEFNRYNERSIVVEDPLLNTRRLVGRFRLNEPEAFAHAAASALDASVVVTPDAIRIMSGPP